MINILHVDPGSKENGGVAVMISLLLKHLDPQCFSQSVWAPHSVGRYLEQRTAEGCVTASIVRPKILAAIIVAITWMDVISLII